MECPGVKGVRALVSYGEGLAEDTDFAGALVGGTNPADKFPFPTGKFIDVGIQRFRSAAGNNQFHLAVPGEIVSADDHIALPDCLQDYAVDRDRAVLDGGTDFLTLNAEAKGSALSIEIAVQPDDESGRLVVLVGLDLCRCRHTCQHQDNYAE